MQDYERIETAIGYLLDHRLDQPRLDEVAAAAGLSPHHLQRVFKRWAGVSPKRFLQLLTVEHAKRLLDESQSVLDAAFETGLSSPARLHDHFVSLEAVTPGQYKERGAELSIRYGVHPSPFGDMFLAVTDRGVCALWFLGTGGGDTGGGKNDAGTRGNDTGGAKNDAGARGNNADGRGDDAAERLAELRLTWPEASIAKRPSETARWAERIFAGGDSSKPDTAGKSPAKPATGGAPTQAGAGEPIPLLVRGTNFQVQVWRALLRIPAGAVTSYGRVAEAVGRPKAVRAVGTAVGHNPVAYLIPCHRVIRSLGVVGEYRWGRERKHALLLREAAARQPEATTA